VASRKRGERGLLFSLVAFVWDLFSLTLQALLGLIIAVVLVRLIVHLALRDGRDDAPLPPYVVVPEPWWRTTLDLGSERAHFHDAGS
jgi:hypothetical protein